MYLFFVQISLVILSSFGSQRLHGACVTVFFPEEKGPSGEKVPGIDFTTIKTPYRGGYSVDFIFAPRRAQQSQILSLLSKLSVASWQPRQEDSREPLFVVAVDTEEFPYEFLEKLADVGGIVYPVPAEIVSKSSSAVFAYVEKILRDEDALFGQLETVAAASEPEIDEDQPASDVADLSAYFENFKGGLSTEELKQLFNGPREE